VTAHATGGADRPLGLALVGVVRRFTGAARPIDGVGPIDLRVERGECVALLGRSGAGKTTLLRLIAGLDRSDGGSIAIDGTDVLPLGPADRRVGMTFDDGALYEHLSVAANVRAGLDRFGIPRNAVDAAIDDALRKVGATHLAARTPESLSAGERRRVALARAIARRPSVLLLDEPLAHLDDAVRRDLREDIAAIVRSLGAAAIVVTHDHVDALVLADRIAFLDRGRLLQVGTAEELEDAEHREVAAGCSWRANNVVPTADGGAVAFRPNDALVDAADGAGRPLGGDWTGSGSVEFLPPPQHGPALGEHATSTIRMDDGVRVRVRVPPSGLRPGERVSIRVPAARIQRFAADGRRVRT
jgi:ABC-type sugar transport system ATPase subunit